MVMPANTVLVTPGYNESGPRLQRVRPVIDGLRFFAASRPWTGREHVLGCTKIELED
jgi:hypothetical protein